jgi:hypothetical protein
MAYITPSSDPIYNVSLNTFGEDFMAFPVS